MTNNIVAGAIYAGFTGLAHRCGDASRQKVFRHNVAHSIYHHDREWENEDLGHGMIIMPDWNDENQKAEKCSEASHNFAYKSIQGIVLGMT